MKTIVLAVHLLVSFSLVALVLIQRGKGADIGAAFGSGASQTVFGARGSGSFLTRATAVLAAVFFVTSLTLAYLTGQHVQRHSVTEVPLNPPVSAPPVNTAPKQQGRQDVPSDVPSAPPAGGSGGAPAKP